ncbi:unnamed protein product [Rotaria sp. Silwood2]|nr:unnamed protein product [Rotaria sp. Silwood2]
MIVLSVPFEIQTWSKSNKDLLYNQVYCGFPTCDTAKVNFVNIQESFKTWYNTTFGHDENCGQILDFNDIDGPLCMCSHRPLKCSHDKWSLSDAIAYTFHEKLDTENRDFPECLAITKLYSYQRKLESSTSP